MAAFQRGRDQGEERAELLEGPEVKATKILAMVTELRRDKRKVARALYREEKQCAPLGSKWLKGVRGICRVEAGWMRPFPVPLRGWE